MITTNHHSRTRALFLVLLFALLMAPFHGFTQAAYWSIFGTSGCSQSNVMNATVSPPTSASFTGLTSINDPSHTADNPDPLAYTTFNATGQPLFSVDQNGVYNPGGTRVLDFTTGLSTSIILGSGSSATTYNINATSAVSEVCVFPCIVSSTNTSYYAVFWATNANSSTTDVFGAVLRAVQIGISASGTVSILHDKILYDATSNGIVATTPGSMPPVIAADAAPCGGARSIYTVENVPSTSATQQVANLRKWVFGAGGSLPDPSTSTYLDQQFYCPAYAKAKILTIGGVKYFSFIASDVCSAGADCNQPSVVALWDITDPFSSTTVGSADVAIYSLPSLSDHAICGFEYVRDGDGQPLIYVSFLSYSSGGDDIDPANSGLAFFSPVLRGNNNPSFTEVSGTSDFDFTDLEASAAGDLFMVKGKFYGAGYYGPIVGSLAYLPQSDFGLSSLSSTSPVTITNSSCSSSPSISVASGNSNLLSEFGLPIFYLGKQYPNEVISYPQITGIDIDTKCAPGYGTLASGAPAPDPTFSVTVTGGTPLGTAPYYYFLWTPESLGVHIPLNDAILSSTTAADPSITGLNDLFGMSLHGPLYTADFWLTVTDGAGCSTGMQVKTHLETSSYDLASKDSPFDLYDEPNDQGINGGGDIWHSPDIWNNLVSSSAGLTDFTNYPPEFAISGSTTNFLYARVRNVGCNPSPKEILRTYWTLGGSYETWPTAWTNDLAVGPLNNLITDPPCLGSVQLPDGADIAPASPVNTILPIDPGQSTIMVNGWTPPNPTLYTCVSDPTLDLCFLSRIVDDHGVIGSLNPDGMTFNELNNTDITTNVSNNNNIVTLNTSVAKVNHLIIRHHIVMLGSGESGSKSFSLQFANNFSLQPGTGISTLSNYVNIKVFLGPLFDVWQRAGGYGTYSSINPDGSVSFDGSNTMRLDSVTLDSGVLYPVEVEFDMLPGVDGRQIPNEMVNLRELYFGNPADTTIDSAFAITIDSTFDSTTTIMSYDTLYSIVYDTLYTPDTIYSNYSWVVKYLPDPPPCPGVLTVTELSNGPTPSSPVVQPILQSGATIAPASGCNYGEMLVSGCGQCSSPTVNVAGWIIDDNDGSFDLAGCSVLAGVTQSHYRLAYDSIWRNVPVGSMIIVYNVDSNCYNLPDTFTMMPGRGSGGALTALGAVSLGNIYYVPLGGAAAYPLGTPHIQRFHFTLDSSLCNYVVDTITSGDSTYDSSYYTYGGNWQNTVNFDTSGDAFQVRCPRCDRDMTTQPAFYHGFGYGADTGTNQFASIPADSNSLGGAVVHNMGAGYKYCFTGSTASDLGDPASWQTFAADPAGIAPPTLGNVNSEYGTAAQNNALNLPCCSPSTSHHHHHDDARTSNGNNGNSGNNPASARNVNINGLQSGVQSLQNLSVFPSPATMTLNFQYTTQANVTIKLFDVTGRLMDEQALQNSTAASFNVGAYAPGIYLYQVITNTNIQSGKVLIGN